MFGAMERFATLDRSGAPDRRERGHPADGASALSDGTDGSEQPRWLFLAGVLPALLVLWIRRAVPETEEWIQVRSAVTRVRARIRDLFQPALRRTTVLVVAVCALGLNGHWAFMFWNLIHFKNLPDVIGLDAHTKGEWDREILYLVIMASMAANYAGAATSPPEPPPKAAVPQEQETSTSQQGEPTVEQSSAATRCEPKKNLVEGQSSPSRNWMQTRQATPDCMAHGIAGVQ